MAVLTAMMTASDQPEAGVGADQGAEHAELGVPAAERRDADERGEEEVMATVRPGM